MTDSYPYKIVAYTPDFADALRRIYLDGRRYAFPWMPAEAYQPGDFDVAVEGEHLLVAVHEDVAVGFVSWWEPDNFIHCLFVDPALHGAGIGTHLLNACLGRIGRPARLKCVVANEAAIRFYARQKWTVVSQGSCDEGAYSLMMLH